AIGGAEAPAAPPTKPVESVEKRQPEKPKPAPSRPAPEPPRAAPLHEAVRTEASQFYAGPSVRRLARELGVDLGKVKPGGPRGRILKEDLRSYVRDLIERGGGGGAIP